MNRMDGLQSGERTLIIIVGQEGTGKSTVIRALLRVTPGGAQIDAEDVGQVNPFTFDEPFLEMLWDNVGALINNFWRAGYATVISGSFLRGYDDLLRFRERLATDATIYVIQLRASKAVRDRRRIDREKSSTQEGRDYVDLMDPEDHSFAAPREGYRYLRVDNDALSVDETVATIRRALPEIYGMGDCR